MFNLDIDTDKVIKDAMAAINKPGVAWHPNKTPISEAVEEVILEAVRRSVANRFKEDAGLQEKLRDAIRKSMQDAFSDVANHIADKFVQNIIQECDHYDD